MVTIELCIMGFIRKVAYIFVAAVLSLSCTMANNNVPGGGTRYEVFATACSNMDFSCFYIDNYYLLKATGETPPESMIFRVMISGDRIEQEEELRAKVLRYVQVLTGKDGLSGSNMSKITYKRARCKSIQISADKPLFGLNPGEDLSAKFVFQTSFDICIFESYPFDNYYYDDYAFFISGTRDVLPIVSGMTIKDYFSYDPYIFSEGAFIFKDIPEKIPDNITFTLKVVLDDGTNLVGSTTLS